MTGTRYSKKLCQFRSSNSCRNERLLQSRKEETKITLLCQLISFFHGSLIGSLMKFSHRFSRECSNGERILESTQKEQQERTQDNFIFLRMLSFICCLLLFSSNTRIELEKQVRDWRQETEERNDNDDDNEEKQCSRTRKSFLEFVLQQILDSHALYSS